jgi:two-component system, chemotaxis family, sensor kinase CheA
MNDALLTDVSNKTLVTEGPAVCNLPSNDFSEEVENLPADRSIRISIDQIDQLMAAISELVLARNQIQQIARSQADNPFAASFQRLNLVTSELQEGIMKTRMQPIGDAWVKLPSLVQDLSNKLGKKVDLQMVGSKTEVDRQILELIRAPMMQFVCSAVSHSVEAPAVRINAGKPETGLIVLKACHEGGHIIIEISDNGCGFDPHAVKPAGNKLDMETIKAHVEKAGGTIELTSVPDKGTHCVIKIPLTLAITSALIVECTGERFAIPQNSVIELVHTSANSEHRIEMINNTPVLRLRNRLLPLVSLHQTLKMGDGINPQGQNFVIVTQIGQSVFGILADRVFDTEEIVVKPVPMILRSLEVFSGNTVLGDGTVVMILDLKRLAGFAVDIRQEADIHAQATKPQAIHGHEKQSLLLFSAGAGVPKAVPLALVARLENIDLASLEYSGTAPVIQYRGKLMQLVCLEPGKKLEKHGFQSVLVFVDGDKYTGLAVDKILDVVEERLQLDIASRRPGMMGTAIIAGKATDIVDAAYYVKSAFYCSSEPQKTITANGEDALLLQMSHMRQKGEVYEPAYAR